MIATAVISIILPLLALVLQCIFAGFSLACVLSIAAAVFAVLAFWR